MLAGGLAGRRFAGGDVHFGGAGLKESRVRILVYLFFFLFLFFFFFFFFQFLTRGGRERRTQMQRGGPDLESHPLRRLLSL